MFYYSIYPPEVILNEELDQKEVHREVEFEGKKMIVTIDAQGEQRITRLISTDPNDFLDPRWNPGNIIF